MFADFLIVPIKMHMKYSSNGSQFIWMTRVENWHPIKVLQCITKMPLVLEMLLVILYLEATVNACQGMVLKCSVQKA